MSESPATPSLTSSSKDKPGQDAGILPKSEASTSGIGISLPLAKTSSHQSYQDNLDQTQVAVSSEGSSDVFAHHADSARHNTKGSYNWKRRVETFWVNNKGLALVILSQLFGVMMNVTIRLLEKDGTYGPRMYPLQILFARMIGTLVLSFTYQWFAKIEHAPFGPREVRYLLVARGVGGFFGALTLAVYGMYYSLQYLPLSDATVITFLAPIVTCWACSILIHEPFTRAEQIAGLLSLFGVILIARPTSLLPGSSDASPAANGGGDVVPSTNATKLIDVQGLDTVTSAQRLSGVGVALIGVLGAACAYTTIRWIGKRAHPLISVNYFAAVSAIASTLALIAISDVGFQLPASFRQWMYLVFLGVCGFVMQFLLTAGMQYEKSSRATNMVYTQELFALAFDKLVWNITPGILSILGSSLILGSALYVAILSNRTTDGKARNGRGSEDYALMSDESDEDDATSNAGSSLRGVQEVQLRTLRV